MAFSSSTYWEERAKSGGTSGSGSVGRLQRFKAEFVSGFIRLNKLKRVIDLGTGDGSFADQVVVDDYVGVDVSKTIIDRNSSHFNDRTDRRFIHTDDLVNEKRADLTLSLDVVYHLVEDDVFEKYMWNLFTLSSKYVIVYSSNRDQTTKSRHVHHRKFTDYVSQYFTAWRLIGYFPNFYPHDRYKPGATSFANFYIFSFDAAEISVYLPPLER